MTPLWTSAEAVAATGGRTTRPWVAGGVSIDTRTLAEGELFVALKDQRDGHDFVAQALAKGAAAALVSHVPDGVAADAPLLIVPDVLVALEALGRAGRARARARVVGVTGSAGKTSTKEMLRAALAGQGQVHAAEASYNNHWGVPLTLARLPRTADFAVIEIGMNHPGEIAPLARLARPHVVVITTVAEAHLAAFEGLAGIAAEKGAICEGLEPGGVAVVHGDLEVSPILIAAGRRAAARVVTFGARAGNHHRLLDVSLAQGVTVARARAWRRPIIFKLGVPGRHFAMNALGVIAASRALGADLAQTILGLADWLPPSGRGTHEQIITDAARTGVYFELIDDAFNANPSSMAAGFEVLAASTPREGLGRVGKGRRIAVLGDMLELGPRELELHAGLAALPGMASVHLVHCVGQRMRALWEALPEAQRGRWHEGPEAMAAEISRLVDAGDVVMVKGSKGSRVSLVVDAIRKMGQRAQALNREE